MSSLKSPRIAITFDPEIHSVLTSYAKKEHISIAKVIRDLVRNSLDHSEDIWLSRLAEHREKLSSKTVSHKDAWR